MKNYSPTHFSKMTIVNWAKKVAMIQNWTIHNLYRKTENFIFHEKKDICVCKTIFKQIWSLGKNKNWCNNIKVKIVKINVWKTDEGY